MLLPSGAVAGAVVLAVVGAAVVGAAVHQGAAVVGAAVGLTGAAVVPGGSTVVGAGVAGLTVVGDAVGLPKRVQHQGTHRHQSNDEHTNAYNTECMFVYTHISKTQLQYCISIEHSCTSLKLQASGLCYRLACRRLTVMYTRLAVLH
jgi:hypothetical protein